MKRTLLWAFCSLFAIFASAQQPVDTAVKPDRTEALPNMIRDLCKTLPHSLSFLFLSTIGSPAVNIFGF